MGVHGGNLREAQEKYGRQDFIDLSANINPFGPPPELWHRLEESLPEIIHYPDPEYKRLTQALSEHFQIPPEQIQVGNGAGELLFSLTLALKPKHVLIPQPGFSEYQRAAQAVQAKIRTLILGEKGWGSLPHVDSPVERQQFIKFWQEALKNIDLVYLNTPHNPTGSVLTLQQFSLILGIAEERNCWVVCDESFYDFLDDEVRWSARIFLKSSNARDYILKSSNTEDFIKLPNNVDSIKSSDCEDVKYSFSSKLIILYSMTKFYALPGLRLGVLMAQPEVLEQVRKFRDPWSVNVLAEAAGIEVIKDLAFPEEVRQKLRESRDFFYNEFKLRKFESLALQPTTVNFALIGLKHRSSAEVVAKLGALGVLVRNCENFEGLEGQYIRTAIKDKPSMQRLLEGLRAIFNGRD